MLDKAKNFIYNDDIYKTRENLRKKFIKKFPLEKIKNLKLNEYIEYGNKNTFCYTLEFKNMSLGIRGGSSGKFGIYQNSQGQYIHLVGHIKTILSPEEIEIYFEKIKCFILDTLNKFEKKDYHNINLDSTPIWKIVIIKILFIYYPDKLLPISDLNTLKLIALILNLENISNNPLICNIAINDRLKEHDIFKSWNYEKLGAFLWDNYSLVTQNFYIINSLDKESFDKKFSKIKVGDFIAIKKNNPLLIIEKIGKVKKIKENEIDIEFFETPMYKELNINGFQGSIYRIKNPNDIYKMFYQRGEINMLKDTIPLNKILYGPPGTGKTYKAIIEAVEILQGTKIENRDLLMEKYLEHVKLGEIVFTTFHQSYGYEEFIEGFKAQINGSFELKDGILKNLCKKEGKKILIIDEINRGNISKIFGEIITLIEDDKRTYEKNQLEIILPYSQEKFSIPNNLFIIGTMNTADRSIALIDIALRRRFYFEEILPDENLLEKIEGVNISKLLKTLNNRIEYLYDRDHTIGHAYFMEIKTVNNLISIIKNKIIPLLQEYFYDDFEKIALILGGYSTYEEDQNYFIYRNKVEFKSIFKSSNNEIQEYIYIYNFTSKPNIEALLNIYEE